MSGIYMQKINEQTERRQKSEENVANLMKVWLMFESVCQKFLFSAE